MLIPTVLNCKTHTDSRGSMTPIIEEPFINAVCVKISRSTKGVIRGFHWQRGKSSQVKYIFILRGEIHDVAVKVDEFDRITNESHMFRLRQNESKVLKIPSNFAHGFQCISEDCEILYICDGPYSVESELTFNPLRWHNAWPIVKYTVSEKDNNGI